MNLLTYVSTEIYLHDNDACTDYSSRAGGALKWGMLIAPGIEAGFSML